MYVCYERVCNEYKCTKVRAVYYRIIDLQEQEKPRTSYRMLEEKAMFGLAAGFYTVYLAAPECNVLIIGNESAGKTALLERLKVTEFPISGKDDKVKNDGVEENSKNMTESIVNAVACTPTKLRRVASRKKDKKKMLPLHKIRPTIGCNFGKTEAFGVKCVFWDVGGKMQPLWERYYKDCHGVIFVLDSKECRYMCGDRERDMKAKSSISNFQQILAKTWKDKRLRRKNIPFMVFASKRDHPDKDEIDIPDGDINDDSSHAFDEEDILLEPNELEKLALTAINDSESETSHSFDDNYYKHNLKVFGGSSKTGEGVNEAIQWLMEELKIRFNQSRRHSL